MPKKDETAIARSLAHIERVFSGKNAKRNLALFSLLAAPWVTLYAIALHPSPRQMWAQRWPTILFVGLYRIAMDRYVQIEGLEHLPATGPVILAGNHINRTAMDGMLMGSKILTERRGLTKFVSVADPPGRVLRHFVRLMGAADGVLLPIHAGMTTEMMIRFLRQPEEFNRKQAILGIFPAGNADGDFETQMKREWHTGAAVAAADTGAAIVPFFVEGLPYRWGPLDMLKAVALSMAGGRAFAFKVRLGSPIRPEPSRDERYFKEITRQIHSAVRELSRA